MFSTSIICVGNKTTGDLTCKIIKSIFYRLLVINDRWFGHFGAPCALNITVFFRAWSLTFMKQNNLGFYKVS